MKTRLFIIIALFLSACERDDICSDTAFSTPNLVIRFYNIEDLKTLSPVSGLQVIGKEKEEAVEGYNAVATDSINIPLRIFNNKTEYILTEDYTEGGGGNPDKLIITYDVIEQFLYRGCGFIAQYHNVQIDIPADEDNWIKAIEIVTPNIENELSAQVKIYH